MDRGVCIYFSIVFLAGGLYAYQAGLQVLCIISTSFAISFGFLAFIKPSILNPFNVGWMRLGYFLGKIVNPIVLGMLFFGLFTPIAVLMRLINRDELKLKKQNCESYWIADTEKGDFRNQF